MQRTTLNLIIDLAGALLFLAMVATGYILFFPLPPGTNKLLMLWGLTRHQWGEMHFWISLGLLAILLVHLALHWQWLVSVVRKKVGLASHGSLYPSALVTFLLVVGGLGALAFFAHQSVREVDENQTGVCPAPQDAPAHEKERPKVIAPHPEATWSEISPVLEKSCIACHGPTKQRGGIRLDRPDDLLGGDSPLVLPGRSDSSPLIAIVTGRQVIFPADRHRLSEVQIILLRKWIEAGAPR